VIAADSSFRIAPSSELRRSNEAMWRRLTVGEAA
jgi:hypothetical protein